MEEFSDELYWGFWDRDQTVIVKAKSRNEALSKAGQYWSYGQTINDMSYLPLNAREIAKTLVEMPIARKKDTWSD